MDANAKVIGRVIDIQLDMDKAIVLNIVLKTGLVKKSYVLPRDIEKIGDKIVLRITGDELRKA